MGGAGRPPGEDGGGERGATMPTTSGVESERPWSNLSTRESKAVIEGILARVPTPPRTPNELTSTNTTTKKKKYPREQKKYPCTQKIFRSNKKISVHAKNFSLQQKNFHLQRKKIYIFSVHLATKSLSARLVAPTMTVYRPTSDEVAHLATCRDTPKGSRNTPQNTPLRDPPKRGVPGPPSRGGPAGAPRAGGPRAGPPGGSPGASPGTPRKPPKTPKTGRKRQNQVQKLMDPMGPPHTPQKPPKPQKCTPRDTPDAHF